VSVNDIVKVVGITKGGFYHYFNSKDELFSHVVEDFINRYLQMFLAFYRDDTFIY
jgi:AcrR family transcriptional regulator